MDLLIPRLHSAQCATEGTDAPVELVAHRSSPSADPAALPRHRQLNCLTPSIEDVDGACEYMTDDAAATLIRAAAAAESGTEGREGEGRS